MTDLSGAVERTVNVVFADIKASAGDKSKRIASIKANIGKVANIPLSEIETSKNIRKTIDVESDSFLRLVESIKKYGVLENIVAELRLNDDHTDYKLVCIAGHRRIMAAKTAKTIDKVPCLLQWYDNKSDSVGAALAENLNREDLHCLDVADGYGELINSGWDVKQLVQHFCRDIRTIKHYLKMAKWPDDIKDLFRNSPHIFSTRVIMRRFAYKRFSTIVELRAAIKSMIKEHEQPKKIKAKSVKVEIDKKAISSALDSYLSAQDVLSDLIKEEIKKAFAELRLI